MSPADASSGAPPRKPRALVWIGLGLLVLAAAFSGMIGPMFLDAGNADAFMACVITGSALFVIGMMLMGIALLASVRPRA